MTKAKNETEIYETLVSIEKIFVTLRVSTASSLISVSEDSSPNTSDNASETEDKSKMLSTGANSFDVVR